MDSKALGALVETRSVLLLCLSSIAFFHTRWGEILCPLSPAKTCKCLNRTIQSFPYLLATHPEILLWLFSLHSSSLHPIQPCFLSQLFKALIKKYIRSDSGWLPQDQVFNNKNPRGFDTTTASPHPFFLNRKGKIFVTATINTHATDFSTCCPCSQAKFSLQYPVQPLVKKQYTHKIMQIPQQAITPPQVFPR